MALPVDSSRDDPDDGWLVQRTLQGDLDAFRLLFQRYDLSICRVILHIVRNPEDMQDVAAWTWQKAWSTLSTLRDRSKFKPWLYKIAGNTARDHLREKGRRGPPSQHGRESDEEGEINEKAEQIADPEKLEDWPMMAEAFEEALVAALRRMRPEQQKCLAHHLQGMEPGAIAQQLGLTEGTVRTYISNAYRILREELRKRLEGDQNNE